MEAEQINERAEVLLDAVDRLCGEWDALGGLLALKFEGSQVPADDVQAALDNVVAATREANALVARALATGGE